MEAQLQSLIDKIKNDGVAEADKKANMIITEAEAKASKIIKDAKTIATNIVEQAKAEAAKAEEAGIKAIEQAGRNLILSLKQSIIDLFNCVLEREVRDSLTSDTLSEILQKVVDNWDRDSETGQELEILMSKKDSEQLTDSLLSAIGKKAKKGITLKPVASIDTGFQIGEKDGSMHYDFTERGLTEILTQYLNPRLADILKGKG